MFLKKQAFLPWMSMLILIFSPILISADYLVGCNTKEDFSNADFSCVTVPQAVIFCGDTINLTRYDRHERMDRELLAFSYMHSTSIQTLKRANRYFPIVEPILKENGVPDDFKYLMAIESACNPLARSTAGAAGLWQFMPITGKEYGLEVNNSVDERYHIEKATKAACKYLKESYARFGNWISVAASYNAGQGRILQQQQKQHTDETLDLYLVEETARYVYRIFVAKMFFDNPRQFGFYLKASDLYPSIPCRTIKVRKNITDLARFAKSQGISYSILRNMNPWLRSSSLHCHSGKEYTLLIPDQEGMHYNPLTVIPHDKRWVVKE